MKAVIVITDAGMPPSAQLVPGAAMLVGSATEAKCLVEKVTWVQLPIYASSQDAVEIAHNELKLAREGRKDLRDTDVLFLLWRKNPKAFSGVHLRIIGRNLCNEAFTFSKIETRAGTYRDSYQDCDDDDRAGEEWKQ